MVGFGLGFGFGRTRRSDGANGPSFSFDIGIMPDVSPTASSAVGPTVAAGDPILVDMNGAGVMIASSSAGTPDYTKVSVDVSSPGYDINGDPTTLSQTLPGLGLLRNPTPDFATPMQLVAGKYITVLQDQVYAGDTVTQVSLAAGYLVGSSQIAYTSIARLDSVTYPKPISGIVNPPYERIPTTGLRAEVAVGHRFARFGRQVAKVEIWVEDSGGNPGPITTVTSMSLSQYTPSSGYVTPRDTPAYVFGGVVLPTGLADGAGRLFYKIYPFKGTVFSSKTDLAANGTWPHLNHPSDGLPCCIDKANAHTEVYAWVNQDGTAGASPAVQTASAADPGSAASYATPAAAAAALKAYNNTRGHNDESGGVVMLRDVAGSTAGANAGSYSTRGTPFSSTTTYTPGLTPLIIRAASGAASQLCRWRGVISDGTTITLANKQVASRIRWQNIYFDSVGLTGTDHTAVYGGGPGIPTSQPTTAAVVVQIFEGCVERGDGTTSNSNCPLASTGFRYDYRHDSRDAGASNASSVYGTGTTWSGLVVSMGSYYGRTTFAATLLTPRIMMGHYVRNIPVASQAFNGSISKPLVRDLILACGEHHGFNITSTLVGYGVGTPTYGTWHCQLLVRATGTQTVPSYGFGNDGLVWEIDNFVRQYVTVSGNRSNLLYNDQGYFGIRKSGVMRHCIDYSFNNKRDTFLAPETPSSAATLTYSSSVYYYKGMFVKDAVPNYYLCIQDAPAGTLLTDTAYFYAIPSAYNAVAFGRQPRRLGAMRFASGVGHTGNVAGTNAAADSLGPTSWYGDLPARDSSYGTLPTYVRDTSSNGSNTFADDGDFTPAVGSVQLNRVRAGEAAMPFDLRGLARLNDGTGAAGALERA